MSTERVLIQRARPQMLLNMTEASKALQHEFTKGCRPDLSRQPVALEPPYRHIRCIRDLLAESNLPAPLGETPPDPEDIIRQRIYISPNERFDWSRAESFIKQLTSARYRIGLEIIGNEQHIGITLLCHRADLPVVSAAFSGEFAWCELVQQQSQPFAEFAAQAWEQAALNDLFPAPPYSHLLTQPLELRATPYEPLLNEIQRIAAPALGIYQCLFQPVRHAHNWHDNVEFLLDFEYEFKQRTRPQIPTRYPQQTPSGDLRQMAGEVERKAHNDKPFFSAAVRVALLGAEQVASERLHPLATFTGLFQHGGRPLERLSESDYAFLSAKQLHNMLTLGLTYRPGFLVNSLELTGLVHVPPASIVDDRSLPIELLDPLSLPDDALLQGTLIGTYRRAGRTRPVRIPSVLRCRHLHLIGDPGMGKSTLMEEMILSDIAAGAGVAVIDPHGDLAERVLGLLPEEAIARTIYFAPGDSEFIPIWNPMQPIPGQDEGRMAADLVASFKSFVSGWGDRLEHLLRNAFFALLHRPGSTFLDVANLLREKSAESKRLIGEIEGLLDNELARLFWREDFARYRKNATGPPQHKLGKLLYSRMTYLMFAQPHSAFSFRRIMDDGSIFLANLAMLGSDEREILGCLVLSLLHHTALSRSDTPPDQRRPFYIFCDEAHRFVTDAIEDLICETRKYGVGLVLAHQHLSQFGTRKADALASVGTTVIFNVGRKDAGCLANSLHGLVDADDLTNLQCGEAILRSGKEIVRIKTPKPRESWNEDIRNRVIAESRRRYCKPAQDVRNSLRCSRDRHIVATPVVPELRPDGSVEEFTYEEFA